MVDHMNVLVDLPDSLARELDRVAPARSRRRSEFIRMAIKKALMDEAEKRTRAAYSARPDGELEFFDPDTWEKKPPRKRRR